MIHGQAVKNHLLSAGPVIHRKRNDGAINTV
jgi:hypothetical protein